MQANIQQLAKIVVFSKLKPDILSELSTFSRLTSYKKDEIIFHEGNTLTPKLHAVCEGSILIQKIAMSGKETNLRQLPAGEIFAAPALFGDSVAPATVIALKDSQIVTIDKSSLLQGIQIAPEIAFQILQTYN